MLLPFLLLKTKTWKHCKMRLFTIARKELLSFNWPSSLSTSSSCRTGGQHHSNTERSQDFSLWTADRCRDLCRWYVIYPYKSYRHFPDKRTVSDLILACVCGSFANESAVPVNYDQSSPRLSTSFQSANIVAGSPSNFVGINVYDDKCCSFFLLRRANRF